MRDIVLLSMLFCHVIADYNLQGCLADLKQKAWWEKNYPDSKYSDDYIVALLCHAFSWSFVVHIPILVLMIQKGLLDVRPETTVFNRYSAVFFTTVILNTWIHQIVDTLKANSKILNLWQDQLFHFLQIVGTWLIYLLIVKLY